MYDVGCIGATLGRMDRVRRQWMRAYAVLAVVGVTCRVVEAVMCDVGLLS